jgi:hypothetical protein
MGNLNKHWIILIMILIFTLVLAILWDVYSIYFDKTRDTVKSVEGPLPSSYLLPEELKEHITNN